MYQKRDGRVVSKTGKPTWWAAIVAAVAFVVVAPTGVLAGPPAPPPVTIADVRVDSNTLSGKDATFRWATSPTSACDTFAYKTREVTTWTAITLPCRVHAVSIGGLLTHRNYDFTITSTARKYSPGTYSGAFSPTDVSLSKAYEGYQYDFWVESGSCGRKYVRTTRVAEMPGDIVFDPAAISNSGSYQVFDVHIKYYAQGEDWCWPWQLVTKRTAINIFVIDKTSRVTDWITSAVDPVPKVASSGSSGTIDWSVNLGTEIHKGTPFGVSLSYVPSTGIGVTPTWHNLAFGSGVKWVAELVVDWNGAKQTSLDIVWPMRVIDSLAQYRLYDQVEVLVSYEMTWDLYNTAYPWVWTPSPWAGHDWKAGFNTHLGFGFDNNGANNLDQYTSVQMGRSSGPT